MTKERRNDGHKARIINAAIQLDSAWGCVSAWRYLQQHHIAPAIALRVLTPDGPRRTGDALHPAVRDARERAPTLNIDQRAQGCEAGPQTGLPRLNRAAALAVEHAIRSEATVDRHYAESLLRIYGLDTATMMRVLFQPHRRRRNSDGA